MSRAADTSALGRRRIAVALLAHTAVVAARASAGVAGRGPLEPAAALADLQAPAGYRVELAAAEPAVVDPVAIAFDEQARLWVVEMRDYPTLAPGRAPTSRIRILTDGDHDGRYETGQTFADDLLFPTGLQPWRGGVIVTLAGAVAYFPDDDGDGRADRQELWYRGFATANEQLRANHPRLAADGWVYVAGGLRGGTIENLRRPDLPTVAINGRDFAFDPVGGEARAVTGNGQFGLTFDDFGRRFASSNRNPLYQVMIDERYQKLNPQVVVPLAVHDVIAAGADSRLYPRSRAMTTSAQHAGQFTAACSGIIYRGDALPAGDYGTALVCEPTANLVHQQRLTPAGAAAVGRPAIDRGEFLSASDEWFRPVNLHVGPDGALYVVDMYRAVIEHPEWMPEELRSRPDLRHGDDRGRIYRIVRADAPRGNRCRPIDARSPAAFVSLLADANAWRRETALRLLLEAGSMAPAECIERLRTAAAPGSPATSRYLALMLLDRLGALPAAVIRTALDDPDPNIRQSALILAESRLADLPELAASVLKSAGDADPRVRFQSALSSMSLPPAAALSALKEIVLADFADQWTCRAVALASRDRAADLLASIMDSPIRRDALGPNSHFVAEVMRALAAQGPASVARSLAHFTSVDRAEQRELLLAAAAALDERGSSLDEVRRELAESNASVGSAMEDLFDAALATLADASASDGARLEAARLERCDGRPHAAETMAALLEREPDMPPAVQIGVLAALRGRYHAGLAQTLLARFRDQLPAVRSAALAWLAEHPQSALALVEAVARGDIGATDVDPVRRAALVQHRDETVRTAAAKLLAGPARDRQAVADRYRPALQRVGDVGRGRQLFAAHCANCHRVGDLGTPVGPDIGDAAMKSPEQLLTDILDPNRAVDANYISYSVITTAGLGYQGVIRAENDQGIVLADAEGNSVTIRRSEIESLAGGQSLMPDGFEQQVSVDQMADLLAFLRLWRHQADAPPTEPPPAPALGGP
ncbi:MAG: hypothetical protein DCC67_00115 [Planctomycetota bacterium]|nr:MAG: hypothetical protein DCC67_00115 [Planctomycetota bacterium]